jgi:hypothetical protein
MQLIEQPTGEWASGLPSFYRGALTGVIGAKRLRVAFSDESSVGSKQLEPIAVATALVMNLDECWPAVEAEMRKIIQETPKHLLHAGQELRGSELYRALREDSPARAAAHEVLTRSLMVAQNQAIQICFHAVDRSGYEAFSANLIADPKLRAKATTSTDRAFDGCVAYVDRFVRSVGEYVLWVSDWSDKHRQGTSKLGLLWLNFLKSSGRDPVSYQAAGYQPLHIADAIFFGRARESLALQLADLCCATITFHFLQLFYGWSPLVEPFWQLISLGLLGPAEPEYRGWTQSTTTGL